MNKVRLPLLLVLLVLLSVPDMRIQAEFETVPGYPFRQCSLNELREFRNTVVNEQAAAHEMLEKKYPGKPEKVREHAVTIAYEIIVATAKTLYDSCEKGISPAELAKDFDRVQRMHYSVRSELDPYSDPSFLVLGIKCGGNYIFGPLKAGIRKRAADKPIGDRQAMLEAERLYRPGESREISRKELAKLTADEISRLDPSSDHPAMRSVIPGNHFESFTKQMVSLIRKTSSKASNFDSAYARRVMFFDEFRESGTSPKIRVKDRYGLSWAMKWGDEVHADVVATRLYIDLGGRFTDLKYYSGPGETFLILAPGKDISGPHTMAEFASILKKSRYKFDPTGYMLNRPQLKDISGNLLGTGQVDAAMLDRESLDPKYLGCYYIAFKECQLSLYNPAVKRLGGTDLSRGSSLNDRVTRAWLVLSTWLINPDLKEDNTRGGFVLNALTGRYDQYVEYISDLGASFAGPFSAGCLSTMPNRCMGRIFGGQFFRIHPVFLPDSWRHCTWADARWMARRIAFLGRTDLERIFAESGWPAFSQQLGVEKMLSRRNDLVKVFGLDTEGFQIIPCNPTLTVKYETENGIDMPVIHGIINPLSSIVRRLQRDVHPEGLFISKPRRLK